MEGLGQPHQVRGQQAQYDNAGQSAAQGQSSSTNKWYRPTLESKIAVILISAAALIVLIAFAMAIFSGKNGAASHINEDQYQAVFLTNGQVYFGKISSMSSQTVVLEDIYYLQVDQQLQPEEASSEEPQVSLAKLGNELHGPEDQMFISPEEIIFWENLRVEGDVSQAIETFRENGTNPAAAEEEEE
ncbi:MAG: hypothetical protein WD467_02680 [Candidatus Saccharimonadales bacterium]